MRAALKKCYGTIFGPGLALNDGLRSMLDAGTAHDMLQFTNS